MVEWMHIGIAYGARDISHLSEWRFGAAMQVDTEMIVNTCTL